MTLLLLPYALAFTIRFYDELIVPELQAIQNENMMWQQTELLRREQVKLTEGKTP